MLDDPNLTAMALPKPTRDLARAKRDIAEFGLCMIEGAMAGPRLARVQQALYRAADDDRARGHEKKYIRDYVHDDTNQRVWNLLSRDPVFVDLVEDAAALDLVRSTIGWPALLGNISANITGPGGGEMILHADQTSMPVPWAAAPQGINVAWCVDDFTDENGATRIVPGSHRLNRPPRPDEADIATVPLVTPAGTMIAFESRVWHKTGFNRTTDKHRGAIFAWYSRPIYRTQENWFLSLAPSVRQFASEDMLVLLGYKTTGIGLVNGASPV